MKKFYLTTPLYYVNDVPHIGHAYTTVAADILARWKRFSGQDVFFLTGTDEHGAKIEKAANDANEQPQDFVNRIAGEYKRLWSVLNISYDDFIQTSEPRHKKVVQEVFEKLKASGDIYKGIYEDWYCLHDESYFSDSEVTGGKCPSCGRPIQKLQEESYFFKLSKYENVLLDYYQKHPDFLSPSHRSSEIINFVKSGLKDLSVSRTRVKWGVPVISDPHHTVYVWFDALLNYVSSPGFNSTSCWPANVHLVGKEIFRFHTVIWPAMLMALGLPLPTKVFAHGWWTVEGTKMSKSLGNVVNPHEMSERYTTDAFRYFLFREVPFGSDGDFSEKSLLNRYNSELANNLGNLMQRTSTLLLKHFDGAIPDLKTPSHLIENIPELWNQIEKHYNNLDFGTVLELAYTIMVKTNKYIDEQAPWKLGEGQKEQIAKILFECLIVLKFLAILLYPFMPTKMQDLWARLGEESPLEKAGKISIPLFRQGQKVIKSDPLFMRIGGRWK